MIKFIKIRRVFKFLKVSHRWILFLNKMMSMDRHLYFNNLMFYQVYIRFKILMKIHYKPSKKISKRPLIKKLSQSQYLSVV
jgi:hypothetical protein